METVHKVGEKVKIRSKEWFDEEFKKIRFIVMGANLTKDHRLYCGEDATITHASPFGYRIDIDNERNLWDDFMFESTAPAGSGVERMFNGRKPKIDNSVSDKWIRRFENADKAIVAGNIHENK